MEKYIVTLTEEERKTLSDIGLDPREAEITEDSQCIDFAGLRQRRVPNRTLYQ